MKVQSEKGLSPLVNMVIIFIILMQAVNNCGASFWDGIPIISQIKSAIQAIGGDTEGAKQTQENFVRQAPGVSQITSAVQAAQGDHDAAKKTQEQFLHETIEAVADNTPVVGHIKGGIHIAVGDTERGENIIKGATSNTAAVIGGVLGGPAGAMAAGTAMDGVITGIDSAIHGEFRPQGTIEHFANEKNKSVGDQFDFWTGIGLEFATGKGSKSSKGKSPLKNEPNSGGFGSSPHRQLDPMDVDSPVRKNNDIILDAGHHPVHYDPRSVEAARRRIEIDEGISREYTSRLQGPDFRSINDIRFIRNCAYCSLAAVMGTPVKRLMKFLNKLFDEPIMTIEEVANIYEIMNYKDVRAKLYKEKMSRGQFRQYIIDKTVAGGKDIEFSIAMHWDEGGGHVVNALAWKNSLGEPKILIKDFQQNPFRVAVKEGFPVSHNDGRFLIDLPPNVNSLHVIEYIRYGSILRKKRSPQDDIDNLRLRTGLDPEYSNKLDKGDFDIVNDIDDGKPCRLCALAAINRMTVKQLTAEIESRVEKFPPNPDFISEAYKKMGLDVLRLSKPMKSTEFLYGLDHQLKNHEETRFTLIYWDRKLGGFHSKQVQAWKTAEGKLNLLSNDYSKSLESKDRFSISLPSEAVWLFALNVARGRQVDEQSIREDSSKFKDQFERLRAEAGQDGYKCGQGKRVIGYVASWSTRPFTIKQSLSLTNAIYAFMRMDESGGLSLPAETISRERLIDLILARRAHSDYGLKLSVSFAVGGWANSQHFSSVLANPSSRQFLISEIERIMNTYKLDGVDIDWEYPVTGGANEGKPEDKTNYVIFLRELRAKLGTQKLISIAGGAGQEAFSGFDVPEIVKYVDWIGVMSYDFFGAWNSKWGSKVGPNAPLRHAAPPGYSGKLNVDWAIKQYVCNSNNQPSKIVMGVPFYGRFWYKTRPSENAEYPLFREAERLFNGSFGGEASYWEIIDNWQINERSNFVKNWDSRSSTAWATDESMVLTYETPQSLEAKTNYAVEHNLSGLMIWSIDHDDRNGTLLDSVFQASCRKLSTSNEIKFKCNPLGTEKRWWTWLDDKEKAGMCGLSAPLYNGFYPRCDPDDPGFGCCSSQGYCGSGPQFCKCKGCVDYSSDPSLLIAEPVKPTREVTWHVGFKLAKQGQPRCGQLAPKLADGRNATCNPDGNDYCCSLWGYCGSGPESCDCKGCVNYKTTST